MGGVEVSARPTRTCDRCGTFAVLESNGFRELCAPCWTNVRHGLEGRLTTIPEMAAALARLVAEYWKPALAISVLKAVPLILVFSQRELPFWITVPYQWVVGSFFEALLMTIVGLGALAGVTDFGKALRAAEPRYLSAVGVNMITNLLVIGGMLLLCLPGVGALAVSFAAIPIAVLEGLPPHRAFIESFRRARPLFWRLAIFASLILGLSLVPGFLVGVVHGFMNATHRELSSNWSAGLRVGSEVFGALLGLPSMLFQLVVWGATRPPIAVAAD